jgi:hypothetical protein
LDAREKYLLKRYGLSLKGYATLFKKQKGVCGICQNPPKPGRNLHVDHNHKTGKVRGLLCFKCNRRLLGNRTADQIRRVLAYLERAGE